ncbi:MAG: peptidylprolyl isomerase [Nanoarchaeota archaeon]|nr:peptidylprolyl isomerase [Nanoarchaeota archaeon]
MVIKKGDKVKVEYTGMLEDGTVFDSSEKHGKPLEFEVGAGLVMPGFEKAVTGMKKGEEKEITLQPADAYGEHKPEFVKKMPKDQLPKDKEIKVGMFLVMALPNGMKLPAKIVDISDTEVSIDLNPPLAGKVLKFKLKVVDITA